jgi:hypothetical protein
MYPARSVERKRSGHAARQAHERASTTVDRLQRAWSNWPTGWTGRLS